MRYLHPLMIFFSIFLLMRGHNYPGGGFTGGLLAAAAFAHYSLAFGVDAARAKLRIDPRTLTGMGLLVALLSGVIAIFFESAFMTGQWGALPLPLLGKLYLGTPLLFDIGVYLVVIGITLTIIFSLSEE
ncbi:Na+/H+ antiporter subunit B [bacterium]|nr:Na+/H+ antiporter subunit B [bacterium]